MVLRHPTFLFSESMAEILELWRNILILTHAAIKRISLLPLRSRAVVRESSWTANHLALAAPQNDAMFRKQLIA
jgi:hypothetical protein